MNDRAKSRQDELEKLLGTERAARRISERCPSCSAPMVGTNPTVLPAARASLQNERTSSGERIFLASGTAVMPCPAAIGSG